MNPVYKVWEKVLEVGANDFIFETVPDYFPVFLLETYRLAFVSGSAENVACEIWVNGNPERAMYYEYEKIEVMKELKKGDKIGVKVKNNNLTAPAKVLITLNFSKMEG